MNNSVMMRRKEQLARVVLMVISIIGGWIFLGYGLLYLREPNDLLIIGLLAAFLFILEFYPLPIWKGYTSISFPILYAIYILTNMSFTMVCYALIVCLVNIVKRRPLRIVFFNPAQLIISIYLAYLFGQMLSIAFPFESASKLVKEIAHFSFLIFPYYIINNIIVDIILLIRPQAYQFKSWKHKTLQELNSFLISYGYLVLFTILGNQNRGIIDVLSFFFFFSPLVGFALLTSIILNLKREKAKLKALFSISSELNKRIAAPDWLKFLADNLQEFINADAWILWKRVNGEWLFRFSSGLAVESIELNEELSKRMVRIKRLRVYDNVKKSGGPAAGLFRKEIGSLLYAPLVLDDELLGLFVFGRIRTKSFHEEDRTLAATLANTLAGLIKTKWLFAEQEKRMILEERNRIARDIHDSVAQSLAGAILNLETADRKFTRMPEDSLRLIQESTEKLRKSLKEVRESIYALRPYPTERVGLFSAISTKIASVQKEHNIVITFEKRGQEYQLSPMVEKIIFDTFQESTQNALKHAEASRIEVLLSYQKEHVLVRIKDNGKGFSLFQAMIRARNHPHFGILHMNEAAEKIYASLQVDSKEGAGTEISLTVPRLGIEGGNINDKAYASG